MLILDCKSKDTFLKNLIHYNSYNNYVNFFDYSSIKQDFIPSLFYLYSFLFLVGRTTSVVMHAAAVHDESLKVAPELFLCPPQSYCTEVNCFFFKFYIKQIML